MNAQVNVGGFGLPTILTIVFAILKWTGHITWSWVWVFAPLWIFWALFLTVAIIFFVVFLVKKNDPSSVFYRRS